MEEDPVECVLEKERYQQLIRCIYNLYGGSPCSEVYSDLINAFVDISLGNGMRISDMKDFFQAILNHYDEVARAL